MANWVSLFSVSIYYQFRRDMSVAADLVDNPHDVRKRKAVVVVAVEEEGVDDVEDWVYIR